MDRPMACAMVRVMARLLALAMDPVMGALMGCRYAAEESL